MSKPSTSLFIGEVAQKTGLRPSALRYYESVGVLSSPKRAGGQRLYEAGIFKQIEMIQSAQRAGFSIEEIKTLLHGAETGKPFADHLQELAQRKLVAVEKLIADAQAMKKMLEAGLTCRCAKIEDCSLFMKALTEGQC